MKTSSLQILIIVAVSLLASSCGGGTADLSGGDTILAPGREGTHARLLTMVDYDSLYTVVKVADPWHPDRLLAQYVLVDRNRPMPEKLPEGTVVKVPLQRSLVYSSVHLQAIDELGCANAVKGVAESQYINLPAFKSKIAKGTIVDVGSSTSPDIEKIINMNPDAILSSPYENSGNGTIATLGVPIIECADYMEQTPEGRAQWLLFLGKLYGSYDRAVEIYNHSMAEYNSLRTQIADAIADGKTTKPKVITETVTSGVWYMPGGQSYMARMLADAGATYPWANTRESGSLSLDPTGVLDRAADADVWLLRTYGYDITPRSLADNYVLNRRFRPYSTGNVWGCNTADANIFNDIFVHPELLLRDYAIILHPELFADETPRYYKKMAR